MNRSRAGGARIDPALYYIKPEYGGIPRRYKFDPKTTYLCRCSHCKKERQVSGQHLSSGVPVCCTCLGLGIPTAHRVISPIPPFQPLPPLIWP